MSPDEASHTEPSEPDALDHIERSSLGRNLVHMLASQAATWTLALALAIVSPRFLGADALGQLRLAFSLWTMAEVFIALGTSVFLTLAIARHRSEGMALLGPVLVLRLIVFVFATFGLGVFVLASNADAELTRIMAIYAVIVLFASANDALSASFIGLERMAVPAAANVASRVLGTILAILVLLAGGDATAVVAVTALANVAGFVILVRAIRRITRITLRGWWSESSMIVRGSVGFLVASAVLVVYQQIDTVVIALFVDREVLGWYATADQLFGTLLFPITILMASVFPVLGRLHTDDRPEFEHLVRRSFSTLLVIATPIGLGIAVIAQQVAPLLFGDDFAPAGDVLLVLGPVIVLTFGSILFGTIALATGRERFWNLVMITAIAMTIPLDLVLVPWADRTYDNGAIGGAMAYVVTESMMVVVGLWKVAPFVVDRATTMRSGKTLLAGAAMVAAAWPFRDDFLAIPIIIAAIVYVAAIALFQVLDQEQRQQLGAVLARVGISNRWHDPDAGRSIE